VLDPSPGAIGRRYTDLTGDGHPDIVALFAQGDERIVLFENDGKEFYGTAPHPGALFRRCMLDVFSMHDFQRGRKSWISCT